jgi:hypothetical protein
MAGSVLPAARTYKGCDRRFRNARFDDDLDDVADRAAPVRLVETRGIEPLTPALQRRCSAN